MPIVVPSRSGRACPLQIPTCLSATSLGLTKLRVHISYSLDNIAITSAISSANMADQQPGDRPFPFFDLPREMRDAVYDSALVDIYEVEVCKTLRAVIYNSAATNVLTTSRQICEEYKQRAQKHATLRIYDLALDRPEPVRKVPAMLLTVGSLRIDIMVSEGDIDDHETWIVKLLHLVGSTTKCSIHMMRYQEAPDEIYPIKIKQLCQNVHEISGAQIRIGVREWSDQPLGDSTAVDAFWSKHMNEFASDPSSKQWCAEKDDFVPLVNR